MRLALTAGFALLLATVAYWAIDAGWLRFNYPSAREFPVRGIDVSHHQGAIDWQKVAADGNTFVFLKATEGGDFVDSAFTTNWLAAGTAGLVRGAYHFFTFCRPAADQLKHLIAKVPAEPGTLPPTLDLEFGGNCAQLPTRAKLIADVSFMIQGIEAHYGKRPILYMTPDFAAQFYDSAFPVTPVWIRDVFGRPSLPAGRPWDFWQYANRGKVDGVMGPVDLNVFRGERAVFEAARIRGPDSTRGTDAGKP